MKNYLIVAVLLATLFICNCSNQKDKKTLDFNNYSFDTTLDGEGLYDIGHAFTIDNNVYVEDYYDFIYYTKNIEERKFLIPGSFGNDNFPIYWRETNLPFRIIKGINSDTLIIVKSGREFVFKRVKNTNL